MASWMERLSDSVLIFGRSQWSSLVSKINIKRHILVKNRELWFSGADLGGGSGGCSGLMFQIRANLGQSIQFHSQNYSACAASVHCSILGEQSLDHTSIKVWAHPLLIFNFAYNVCTCTYVYICDCSHVIKAQYRCVHACIIMPMQTEQECRI